MLFSRPDGVGQPWAVGEELGECVELADAPFCGGGQVGCDTRSHVVSELVKEVWLMPGT